MAKKSAPLPKEPKKKVKYVKGFQKIPLIELEMADWNYKKFNDPELQNKLVANIKKNGQIENLITHENEKGQLVVTNGNHRYLAMQTLQFDSADCYHLGKLTDAQAKRIAIETNETKFATDKKKLAELVDTLAKDFEDFASTNPFDEKEMDAFSNMLKDDETILDDETKKEKPNKSKTVVSGGGESYTTLKMELTPSLAERFNNALAKFNFLTGNEKPLDVLLQFVELHTVEQIMEATNTPQKKHKAIIKRK